MLGKVNPEINNDLVTYSSNEFNVVSDGYLLKNGQVPGYIVEYINGYIDNALGNNPQINSVIRYIDSYKLEVANLLDGLQSNYSGLGSDVVTVQELLSQFNYSLLEALSKLNVAENEYKQYLVKQISDYESYIASINALNSRIDKSSADVVTLLQTYATKEFAQSTAASVVQASLNNGAIGAKIRAAETSMATQYGAMAQRVNVLESTFNDVASGVKGFATATQELQTFVGYVDGNPTGTGMLARLEIIEKQTDGILETFTGTHDVVTNAYDTVNGNESLIVTAEPYATWLEKDTNLETGVIGVTNRVAHVGDTYIQYQVVNGTNQYKGSFKFVRVNETTFNWSKIVDTDASAAMAKALEAVGLVDGKSTTFVTLSGQTTLPVNPQEGDLWYDARTTPATLKVWVKISTNPDKFEWQLADSQYKHFFDVIYTPTIVDIKNQVDNKLEYWFQESDPSDLWKDTTTKNKHVGDVWYNPKTQLSYYYNSERSWVLIQDAKALEAVQAAAKAQAAADGKVSHIFAYEGNTAPVAGTNNSWYNYKYYLHATVNPKILYEQINTSTGTWAVYDATLLQEGDILTTYNPVKGDYYTYYRKGTTWVTPIAGGFISQSSFATNLTSQVDDVKGNVDLLVDTTTTLKNDVTTVQNQFMYNSDMTINGKKYKAGFGLRQVGTSANGGYYDSEFVINANKFKFTDGVINGVNPFTITNGVVYANNLVIGAGSTVQWSSVSGADKPESGATKNTPRGEYSSAVSYLKGDIVTYNGSSYIYSSAVGGAGYTPGVSSNWQLLAEKGEVGESPAESSANLLSNSTFMYTVQPFTAGSNTITKSDYVLGLDVELFEHHPSYIFNDLTGKTAVLLQHNKPSNYSNFIDILPSTDWESSKVAVLPEEVLEFSTLFATNRCNGQLLIAWLSNSNTQLAESNSGHFGTGTVEYTDPDNLQTLDKFVRIRVRGTAPLGAVWAVPVIRKFTTVSYASIPNSWLAFREPYLSKVSNMTVPVTYSPAAAFKVHGNAVIDGTLEAKMIRTGHIGSVMGTNVAAVFNPSNIGSIENLEFSPGNTTSGIRYYEYAGRVSQGTVHRKLTTLNTDTGTVVEGVIAGFTKTPNIIGEITYTNPTTVPVSVQLLFFGRTGFRSTSRYPSNTAVGTMFITRIADGVWSTIGSYGWSPMEQDSKAFSAFDVVAPDSTVRYVLESYKGYNIPTDYAGNVNLNVDTYAYAVVGTFTLTGVIS